MNPLQTNIIVKPKTREREKLLSSSSPMSRGPGRLIQNVTQFADAQFKQFSTRYGQQVIDILDFPIKLVLSPFTLAFDIAGSAPRGFGIPEFISKLSYLSVFVSC